MEDDYKILQMIPAFGWYANFQYQENRYQLPVICWVLIEDNESGFPKIKGMAPLDGSDMLWTPDEVESCFSGPDTPSENCMRFLQYTQILNNLPGLSICD